jgi:hypothetical protein
VLRPEARIAPYKVDEGGFELSIWPANSSLSFTAMAQCDCQSQTRMNRPIQSLLGLSLSSPILSDYIAQLTSCISSSDATVPNVKSFSDAVYLNYFPLGLSLLFAPQSGYKPAAGSDLSELNQDDLILESIDIYNAPPAQPASNPAPLRRAELAFSTFALLPLTLSLAAEAKDKATSRPTTLLVKPELTGKDFVETLREPDRKGGGSGPSSGSIGIWCEWSNDGFMVEFGGNEARGPQAWDRGKDATWRVLTLFTPGSRM